MKKERKKNRRKKPARHKKRNDQVIKQAFVRQINIWRNKIFHASKKADTRYRWKHSLQDYYNRFCWDKDLSKYMIRICSFIWFFTKWQFQNIYWCMRFRFDREQIILRLKSSGTNTLYDMLADVLRECI